MIRSRSSAIRKSREVKNFASNLRRTCGDGTYSAIDHLAFSPVVSAKITFGLPFGKARTGPFQFRHITPPSAFSTSSLLKHTNPPIELLASSPNQITFHIQDIHNGQSSELASGNGRHSLDWRYGDGSRAGKCSDHEPRCITC